MGRETKEAASGRSCRFLTLKLILSMTWVWLDATVWALATFYIFAKILLSRLSPFCGNGHNCGAHAPFLYPAVPSSDGTVPRDCVVVLPGVFENVYSFPRRGRVLAETNLANFALSVEERQEKLSRVAPLLSMPKVSSLHKGNCQEQGQRL